MAAGPSDRELLELLREGDDDAYAELWRRHQPAALRAAHQYDHSTEAEDIVAEAFARVLNAVRGGNGPTESFRAYVLRAVSHVAQNTARTRKRTVVSDDAAVLDAPVEVADPAIAELDRHNIAQAYERLTPPQREILWYVEVERTPTKDAAVLMGLSANAAAAMAGRAREALRREYLQTHIAHDEVESQVCRETLDRLGRYVRGSLSPIQRRRVDKHIHDCAPCSLALAELSEVGATMRVVLGPIVLGTIPAAIGYFAIEEGSRAALWLATVGGGGAAAGAGAASASTGATAGGAGGSAGGGAAGGGASSGAVVPIAAVAAVIVAGIAAAAVMTLANNDEEKPSSGPRAAALVPSRAPLPVEPAESDDPAPKPKPSSSDVTRQPPSDSPPEPSTEPTSERTPAPSRAQAPVPAPAPESSPPPEPEPSPEPSPEPTPGPTSPPPSPEPTPEPTPEPSPEPTPPPPSPEPTPEPTPEPSPEPTPPPPSPTPPPSPPPSPPPDPPDPPPSPTPPTPGPLTVTAGPLTGEVWEDGGDYYVVASITGAEPGEEVTMRLTTSATTELVEPTGTIPSSPPLQDDGTWTCEPHGILVAHGYECSATADSGGEAIAAFSSDPTLDLGGHSVGMLVRSGDEWDRTRIWLPSR